MTADTSKARQALQQRAQQPRQQSQALTINALIGLPKTKKRFEELLGTKAAGFMSSLLAIVRQNKTLQACDPNEVLQVAAMAATLDLPINPNLGFAYIVPYKGRPSFQMGYKGYVQLALRSGQYSTISAGQIYEGEILKYDRIRSELELNPDGRTSDVVVGYVAYFRLINGFEKFDYMNVDEVKAHAQRYSQAYRSGRGSPWQTNFDEMASKTVLKRLLSRYGIMSVDMQKASLADQALPSFDEDGDVEFEYIDNPAFEVLDAEGEEEGSDELPG